MENKILSPVINGIRYNISNKDDCIQSELLKGNQWNSDIIDIIKQYISSKKLSHFLNIGCHIGTISLPISLYINKVTSVEAYPDTYTYLQKNIALNNITNVNTYNLALGNSSEEIYFMGMDKICELENIYRVKNNTGGMHIFTQKDINEKRRSSNTSDRKITNKIEKLDNLNIDNFDIMLVDIEGSEYNFLLGSTEKIKKNKPIIIIEIWDNNKMKRENMNMTREKTINYITSLNYKLVKQLGDDFIFEPL
jgi:FkbM family methyltransferase